MTLVVTGATGFLGGALVRDFRQQGLSLRASGRDAERAERLRREGVQLVLGELSRGQICRELCSGAEKVVHCAALSSPWGAPAAFEQCNVQASQRLFRAAQNAGVQRFVHISTPSLYMGWGDRLNVGEDEPLPPPMNAYSESKRRAEEALLGLAQEGETELVILRPRALYGPGDLAIFPRLIEALRARRLPQIGAGQNVVDLTHISDAVKAVNCALREPLVEQGRIYNVTSGQPVQLWPLIRSLCHQLELPPPRGRVSRRAAFLLGRSLEWTYRLLPGGREPPLTRYLVEVLSRSMTLDISRARRELRFAPQIHPEAGIRDFVEQLQGEEP